MNLVLLTFGERLENHYQASFAIFSFLKDPAVQRVIVITDRPEFYAFFEHNIEILAVDETDLTQWQGAYQFFWRIKIKALELVQQKYPDDHLLYIDSDTFLATELSKITQGLAQNCSFMHKMEYQLQDKISNTVTKMHQCLKGKSFAGCQISSHSEMWNAGVIALPKAKAKEIIRLSLLICDEICTTDCPRRLVEQFAFSLALANCTQLQPCHAEIGHYWGNKAEWNKQIEIFMIDAFLKKRALQDCVTKLAEFNWNSLPIIKKQRSTNRKLVGVVDKLFPAKQIQYFAQK